MKAIFAVAIALSLAGCSSNDVGAPAPDGGSGSSGSGSSSGTASSSGSGSSSSSSTSSSGASGASSTSSSSSSSSGTSGTSGGGFDCAADKGDSCLCFPASSSYPANATPCAKSALKDPGACCAEQGWPKSGMCRCAAFLCYVNSGGGKDCNYNDLGANGLEVPTTSATGAVCCIKGDSSIGYFCACYGDSSKGSCDGSAKVPSCTMDVLPPCKDIVTNGYTPVDSCR